MKSFLQITSLLCLMIFNKSYAQCPQNTEPGSTVNFWDWREESYQMYIKEDNGATINLMVISPFHSLNNTFQENVYHLSLLQEFDFEPSDGWELIYKNFGSLTFPVAEPSFALYNRYTGLLRTFIWLTANEGNTYQAARLKMDQFIGYGFPNNSAIFSANQTPLSALDNFPKNTINTAINSYKESVGTWLLSEMTLMYDPCTCDHRSAIETEPVLTSLTKVDLNIAGTSLSTAIYDVTNGGNQSLLNGFTGLLDGANNLTGAIKEGQTVYKDLNSFGSFIGSLTNSYSSAPTYIGPPSPVSGLLSGFLSALPVAGTILNVFDLLIGGGGNTAAKTLTGYSTQHRFHATGDLTTIAPYQPNLYFTPGADHTNSALANIPIYDNITGTANLLLTPVIKRARDNVYETWQTGEHYIEELTSFRLDEESIKVVVNENAGLAINPKFLRGAIIMKESVGDPQFFYDQGMVLTGVPGEYRTPFMPFNCLSEFTLYHHELDATQFGAGGTTNILDFYAKGDLYLRVVATINTDAGTDVQFLGTYKIKFEEAEYEYYDTPINPYLNIPTLLEVDYNNFITGGTFIAWDQIIVTGAPRQISVSGDVWNIFSPQILFKDLNGDVFDPQIPEFTIDSPFPSFCEITPLATQQEIDDFCENIYSPAARSSVIDEVDTITQSNSKPISFKSYPNPVVDFVTVSLPKNFFEIKFTLLNQLGQVVSTKTAYPIENHTSLDYSDISPGIYTLIAEVNNSYDGYVLFENQRLVKL